jgi:hypothetical protein
VRALLIAAGLPRPRLNVAIDDEGRVICDLVYKKYKTVVEHEGSQHQEDRAQYTLDLGRYAWMRRNDVEYVQSTHEKLTRPRSLVGEVYVVLAGRGYVGPPPDFGQSWERLFTSLSAAVGREYPVSG